MTPPETAHAEPLERIAALDCATTGADYLVFVVGYVYPDGVELVTLYRRRNVAMADALAAIVALCREHEVDRLVVETTGGVGELYRQQLARASGMEAALIGFSTTASSKPMAIERLLLFVERGWLAIPTAARVVREELEAFQRNGKKLEAASGKHDDTVMALAFLVSIVDLDDLENGEEDDLADDHFDTTQPTQIAPAFSGFYR